MITFEWKYCEEKKHPGIILLTRVKMSIHKTRKNSTTSRVELRKTECTQEIHGMQNLSFFVFPSLSVNLQHGSADKRGDKGDIIELSYGFLGYKKVHTLS